MSSGFWIWCGSLKQKHSHLDVVFNTLHRDRKETQENRRFQRYNHACLKLLHTSRSTVIQSTCSRLCIGSKKFESHQHPCLIFICRVQAGTQLARCRASDCAQEAKRKGKIQIQNHPCFELLHASRLRNENKRIQSYSHSTPKLLSCFQAQAQSPQYRCL